MSKEQLSQSERISKQIDNLIKKEVRTAVKNVKDEGKSPLHKELSKIVDGVAKLIENEKGEVSDKKLKVKLRDTEDDMSYINLLTVAKLCLLKLQTVPKPTPKAKEPAKEKPIPAE